jgi:hypothetical protein
MARVDARAPDLDHARTQQLQPGKVELGLRVVAADAARCVRGKQAVGADHLATVLVAHQQVLAVRIEQIVVEAVLLRAQPGPHLLDEHAPTQSLRLAPLGVAARETHRVPASAAGDRARLEQQAIVNPVHRFAPLVAKCACTLGSGHDRAVTAR